MYSATAGSVDPVCPPTRRPPVSALPGIRPATSAGGLAKRAARVALAIAPKTAAPTALPSERLNMLVPVTTPRRSHLTTDCTATNIGLADRPSPTPTTKAAPAVAHTDEFGASREI